LLLLPYQKGVDFFGFMIDIAGVSDEDE